MPEVADANDRIPESLQVCVDEGRTPGNEEMAHLAKRYHEYERSKQEAAWYETCGEHLRAAFAQGGPAQAAITNVTIVDGHVSFAEYPYYNDYWSAGKALGQFKELFAVVPEQRRTWYAASVGVVAELFEDATQGREWYEEALRYESREPRWMWNAWIRLARNLIDEEPQDLPRAAQALERAVQYLDGAEEAASDDYDLWIDVAGSLARNWLTNESGPAVWRLAEAAVPLAASYGEDTSLAGSTIGANLGVLLEAAGQAALRAQEPRLTEHFLVKAQNYAQMSATIAAQLARLYMEQGRWQEALEQQRRVVELDLSDGQARYFVLLLSALTDAANPADSLRRLEEGMREVLAKQDLLQAGQDLLLDEVMLQRDTLRRISETQERSELLLARGNANSERVISGIIDELHRLVQEGSRVQPSALTDARNRLSAILGEDCYGGLSQQTRDFLDLAETLYDALRDLPKGVDASVCAVEYSKAVEVELRRFMKYLAGYLDINKHNRPLSIGTNIGTYQGQAGWAKFLCSDTFTLGSINALFENADKPANKIIGKFVVDDLGLGTEAFVRLIEDSKLVTTKYRNPAAHVNSLSRSQVAELRDLLLRGSTPLMRRLVELRRAADEWTPLASD